MIETLIIDLDGVLTDGTMHYHSNGILSRSLHAQDIKGISLAEVADIRVLIVTASPIPQTSGIRHIIDVVSGEIHTRVRNKQGYIKSLGIDLNNTAFIGDDINDFSLLSVVKLPIAVNSAVEEIKKLVKEQDGFITHRVGGQGAVREAIERILKEEERWESVIKQDVLRQLTEAH